MASRVVIFSDAEDDLVGLPAKERERMALALRTLADFPTHRAGIKKLKPPFTGFRKRVGDYRVLFDLEDDVIFVRRIVNRKDVYR